MNGGIHSFIRYVSMILISTEIYLCNLDCFHPDQCGILTKALVPLTNPGGDALLLVGRVTQISTALRELLDFGLFVVSTSDILELPLFYGGPGGTHKT